MASAEFSVSGDGSVLTSAAASHRTGLLWAERTIVRTAEGQLQLSVPLSGVAPPPGASARLGRLLDHLWVVLPAAVPERQLTSVVAVIWQLRGPQPRSAAHALFLLMTAPSLLDDHPFDDPVMAVELAAALHAVCSVST